MKVLLVNSVYGQGSTGKIVSYLHNYLNDNGIDCITCYGRGQKIIDKKIVKISHDWEFYLHAFISRIVGINGFFSFISTRKLTNLIEYIKPDVVHLHNIHGYYLNIFELVNFLKRKKLKVIWTLHDELMFTGNCGYSFYCDKWQNECKHCKYIKEYPISLFFDFSNYLLNKKRKTFGDFYNCHIITPSLWLKEKVKKSILKNLNVDVIENGIDIDNIFHPNNDNTIKQQLGIDGKMVLTVSDDIYSKRKGIDKFIELAELSFKRNDRITYVLIGGKVEQCNLPNVKFVNLINNQKELAKYYSEADCFVITSQLDNLPTVCLESIACGTPVVGFITGGIPETVKDDSIGQFVELNDIDELYKRILMFLQFDHKELQKKCNLYSKENLSIDVMTKKYLELYNNI